MTIVLALAIAKFLDPLFFVLVAITTFWVRGWFPILLTAFIMAMLYQGVLVDSRGYAFLAAWIAMTAQALIAAGIWKLHRRAYPRAIK
jgi:hypothetical protein